MLCCPVPVLCLCLVLYSRFATFNEASLHAQLLRLFTIGLYCHRFTSMDSDWCRLPFNINLHRPFTTIYSMGINRFQDMHGFNRFHGLRELHELHIFHGHPWLHWLQWYPWSPWHSQVPWTAVASMKISTKPMDPGRSNEANHMRQFRLAPPPNEILLVPSVTDCLLFSQSWGACLRYDAAPQEDVENSTENLPVAYITKFPPKLRGAGEQSNTEKAK